MSRLLALIKISLKSGSNFSGNKGGNSKKGIISAVALVIVMIMCFAAPMEAIVSTLYDGLSQVGQEGVIIGLITIAVSFTIFIFGIIYVMGTFYFSKDIEYLLPLPLKPWEITVSKFITVLIYEYLTEAIILVIPLITFGVRSQAGALYWLISIIVFIILPIFPLVIATIINIILMSFTNIGKHKEKLRTLFGIISVFLGMGISLTMSKFSQNIVKDQSKLIEMISSGNNSMVATITAIFPTAKFSSLALINSQGIKSFYYILALLATTIAAVLIFILIANALYFKGALGGAEVAAKRTNMKNSEFSKATKKNSIIFSYTIKELKILFRTPAYLINCVLMSFLWPIFLIIPMVSQAGALGELTTYMDSVKNLNIDGTILAIVVSVMFFISGSNMVSATAISREGENVFFMKYIPISYKNQILSKVLSGGILSLVSLVFLIAALIMIKMDILFIMVFIVISIIAGLVANFICILVDLSKPKLKWDNEQMAVKQNFRSMISFFTCAIIAGLNIFIFIKSSLSFSITALILFIEMLGLLLILNYILNLKCNKYFEDIE